MSEASVPKPVLGWDDLEIEISRCVHHHKHWEIRALESPLGRTRGPYRSAFRSARSLQRALLTFEKQLQAEGREAGQARERAARDLGGRLFRSLCTSKGSEVIASLLSHPGKDSDSKGLRIRLSFGAVEDFAADIVAAPWELLWNPDSGDFLSHGGRSQVVRYLDVQHRYEPIPLPHAIKVLAVLASPSSDEDFLVRSLDDDIEQHRAELEKALGASDQIRLHILEKPTLKALTKKAAEEEFHALYFYGHGFFHEDTGLGELFFEDDDGSIHRVSGRTLMEVLEASNHRTLRLAIVNACQTGTPPRDKDHLRWAGVAASLVTGGFSAVVSMQFPISGDAALAFSAGLYRALAQGSLIDEAVAAGRAEITRTSNLPNDFEWAIPMLTLQSKSGQVFRVESDAEKLPIDLGILAIEGHGGTRLRTETDRLLDLRHRFTSRFHDPEGGEHFWNQTIAPELERFLQASVSETYPNIIDFAAHSTIAFASGYFVPAKSGIEIAARQRGVDGTETWHAYDPVPADAAGWESLTVEELPSGGPDLAVAVGLSAAVEEDVRRFLNRKPTFGRLLVAELSSLPGQRSIRSGGHAFKLAEVLTAKILELQSQAPESRVHLFFAAPNAFVFFLGRTSQFYGKITLYEFFREERTYVRSMSLPIEIPPESRAYLPWAAKLAQG